MNTKMLFTLMKIKVDLRGDFPAYINGEYSEMRGSNLPMEFTLSQLLGQIKAGEDEISKIQEALTNMRKLADDTLLNAMSGIKDAGNKDTVDAPRVAVDIEGTELAPGDTVMLIDAKSGGDTDESWDLIEFQRYDISEIHDEENLHLPMIILKGTTAGPVFAERFVRIAKGKTKSIVAA